MRHPLIRQKKGDASMHIRDERQSRNSNGLNKQEREKGHALASCVIGITKLSSDYIQSA